MKIKRLMFTIHRDAGFFFAGLILIYAISGVALNHVGSWDPDFSVERREYKIDNNIEKNKITKTDIVNLSKLSGEHGKYYLYDFPTDSTMKIYFDNASLEVFFKEHKSVYEKVSKRAFFYQINKLHRAVNDTWIVIADIFAGFLVLLTVSGFIIAWRKKYLLPRGIILIALGILLPLFFIFFVI